MIKPYLMRLAVILIVALVTAPLANSADYAYYGYSPACPKNSSEMQFEQNIPLILNEVSFKLILEIDDKGNVGNVDFLNEKDSVFAKLVVSELTKLQFEPAQKRGLSVKSKLPVLVTINPRFKTTMVEFPIEQGYQVLNLKLYFEAMRELGLEAPDVKKYPSYFCNVKVTDSLTRLPYTLISLKLDRDGKAVSSRIVDSNIPAFNPQMQSAVLWSEFTPLKIDNQPAACSCFLLISFFPQVQYPAKEYHLAGDSVGAWYERWRVRLLPDTIGLMIPATPGQNKFADLALEKEYRALSGEIFANLIIDTLGNMIVRSTDTRKPEYHKAIRGALKNVRFFPATRFDGSPVEFSGTARFTFSINKSVKADFLWLDK